MDRSLALINIRDTFLGSGDNPLKNPFTGIPQTVSLVLNLALAVAGIVLIFFFIIGGINLIGSAGKNDPQKAEQAKKTITSAVIGFVIVFASYWIVKLIGQLIGVNDLLK